MPSHRVPPHDPHVNEATSAESVTREAAAERAESTHPVVLFDGVCNLCNATVQFLVDHDPDAVLRFASLQSEPGARILAEHGMKAPEGDPDSVLLVEDGRVFERSSAALRIARHLRGFWKLFYVFVIVPRPLRDLVYRFIAHHRYRWFGKSEQCRVPTPELRARFLS